MGSALIELAHRSVPLVKKVISHRVNFHILATSCLHYATKEGRTKAQINVPDVLVPAEYLQHREAMPD